MLFLGTSCVSNKNMTYLQGADLQYAAPQDIGQEYSLTVQSDDQLAISVSSKDAELIEPFNTQTLIGGGSSSTYSNTTNTTSGVSYFYVDKDGSDLDNFSYLATVEKNILGFVSQGGSLYISSPNTGNGKTSWALRMIQAYFDKIWYKADSSCHALFVHVPRFLLSLKDNISQRNEYAAHVKENAIGADLVVWDEIGTKGLTQFEHENILNYVNARLDAGKANIYTSNLTDGELRAAVGDRLYSRIVLASDCVVLRGKDKRGLR